jgi:anti-sigma factor RsiW
MFFSRGELVCREVVELISDYIEGELPRPTRRRLESHLRGCEHCSEYLAQMRTTIRITGGLRTSDLPPEVRDELIALYRRWRVEAD